MRRGGGRLAPDDEGRQGELLGRRRRGANVGSSQDGVARFGVHDDPRVIGFSLLGQPVVKGVEEDSNPRL